MRAHALATYAGLAMCAVLAASGEPAAASNVVASRSAAATVTSVANRAPAETAPGRDDLLTTIVLVRHAEKDTLFLGTDTPLSRAGAERARELARVLEEADVAAIYVTEWRRNRETAEPLAAALGETLQVLRGRDFAAQARTLRAHRGETVVVIGHSDTIPELHEALTGTPWRGYRAGEWDPILVVTLGPDGAHQTITLKYGEPARGR